MLLENLWDKFIIIFLLLLLLIVDWISQTPPHQVLRDLKISKEVFSTFFRLLFLNICPPSRFWFQREGGNWFWSWSSPFLSQNNFEIRHQQQQYTSPHNHSETMFILIPSQINQIDICSLSYASNLMSLTAPPPQYQPFLK